MKQLMNNLLLADRKDKNINLSSYGSMKKFFFHLPVEFELMTNFFKN